MDTNTNLGVDAIWAAYFLLRNPATGTEVSEDEPQFKPDRWRYCSAPVCMCINR
jgi:hypothetical protein